MNEMIPRPNALPADKAPKPAEEPILDPKKFVIATELAPSVISIEEVGNTIRAQLEAAPDYDAVMAIFTAAIAQYGHQTMETILLARFTSDPTPENKVCLDLIKGMVEMNTVESEQDPDFEGMASIFEMVSKYSTEEIQRVASITTPEEALASSERKRMKDDLAPLYKLACKLRWESKAALDEDRTLYPEFWQIFDKFEAIHQAIGIVNSIQKTVRHTISVK